MQNPRPAPLNVVADDPTGATWALPEGAIGRLGKGVKTNSPETDCIALSPDRTYFAAGTGMGLWFYDVKSMSPIALWETERGLISNLDISPDGKSIVIANWDGIVKVLDIQSGEITTQMERYKLYSFVKFLTFSPDGQLITSAPWKQNIEILDVQRGECIAKLGLEPIKGEFNIYAGVEFSPNGQYLAVTERPINPDNGSYTLSRDGSQTAVWDPITGKLIAKFPGNKFAFSPDSKVLACACPDDIEDQHQRYISVWNIETNERIAYFKAHDFWIDVVTFSPCGQFLVSADRGGCLRVWELTDHTLNDDWTHPGIDFDRWNMEYWRTRHFEPEFRMSRIDPTYSQDGKLFAVVFPDDSNTVEVWDIKQRKKLQSIERLHGSVGSAWLRKCPELAIANTFSNLPARTDKTTSWAKLQEPIFLPLTDSDLDSMLFSRDGQKIVSKSDYQGTVLWDVPHTNQQGFSTKLRSTIRRLMTSDAKRKEAFEVSRSEQITEQKQAWKILKDDSRYNAIDWSKKRSKRTFSITVSPCGNIIATGLYGEIRLWNIEEPIPVDAIPQPKESIKPYAIAFSSCGRYIASGTWWQKGMENMAIRLWEVESGKLIHTFWGHSTDIQSLTFSPDDTILASGSFDGTVLLWDVKPYVDV